MEEPPLLRPIEAGSTPTMTGARRLSDPLGAAPDVVIPWVDYSDPAYCRAVTGRAPACSGEFGELRWQLRSYERSGLLARLGRIFVVHSDLHPPPRFLRSDHPRLRFVRHSELVRDPALLPLTTREAITAHVKEIPTLSEWFLYAADDNLAMQSWEVLAGLLRPWGSDGPVCVFTEEQVLARRWSLAERPWAAWLNGAFESSQLLEQRFGKRLRYLDTHVPRLMSRTVLDELEQSLPDQHRRTQASQHEGHLSIEVLHDEYLVDIGAAVRRAATAPGADGIAWGREIHTNGVHLAPPATPDKVKRLRALLVARETDALWVNLQGPGISDEYPPEPGYRALVEAWLLRLFPEPSELERPR